MIFATLSVMGFLLLEDRAYISIATAEFQDSLFGPL